MPTSPTAALRLMTAELAWLLSLRPGRSAALVAAALGVPVSPPAGAASQGSPHALGDDELLRPDTAIAGDVLTSAEALVSVGTADALAALAAIGRDRVLLVVPDGRNGFEIAAVDGGTPAGEAVAEIAARLGTDAVVMVADAGGTIRTVEAGPGLAGAVQALVPERTT
ncbi:hypothetical protein OCAE111667_07685 [Occultella aeris]|uniref:Uncharacterized protein n=1 Tax=Occultella aeris TaxID=2761496 RepID=A0A7M4DP87_9MICO|nr:hypothetical protein [Occultella aeris]VZO39273.1 hypothetical protein HALOF300_03969 [Occultella aeris]